MRTKWSNSSVWFYMWIGAYLIAGELAQSAAVQTLQIEHLASPNKEGSEVIVSRDFDEGIGIAGEDWLDRDRAGRRIEAVSGQLLTGIDLSGAGTIYRVLMDGNTEFLPLDENRTLEVSVDVIEQEASVQFGVGDYIFGNGESSIGLLKESQPNLYNVPIFWETTELKRNLIKMVMRLTPQGENLLIQLQIVELDFPNAVLFNRYAVDTPGQDAVTPLPETWQSSVELTPAPAIGGTADFFAVGVFNFSSSSSAEITFDNLEASTLDASFVRLSWPEGEEGAAIEWASSVKGPWSSLGIPLVQEGRDWHAMVPVQQQAAFFRLRME